MFLKVPRCVYACFFAMQSPMTVLHNSSRTTAAHLTHKSLRPHRSARARVPPFTRERQRRSSRERESSDVLLIMSKAAAWFARLALQSSMFRDGDDSAGTCVPEDALERLANVRQPQTPDIREQMLIFVVAPPIRAAGARGPWGTSRTRPARRQSLSIA